MICGMRSVALCATLGALACGLTAQVFYAQPSGYTRQEVALPNLPGNFLTFPGGAAFDSQGNFYFWDGASIRRKAEGAPPLITLPQQGAYGIYPDDFEFDPNSPDDLYIVESSEPGIYKLTRDGLDSVAGTPTYVAYPFPNTKYLYDLAFDPVSGELFASGAEGFGTPPVLYVINRTTLEAVKVADISSVTNGSGPIAFDAQGNLFASIPAPYGSNGPVDFIRFPAARIAAALAANPLGSLVLDGEDPLDADEFIEQADGFMNPSRMGFRTEGGKQILYFTGADEGTIYRSDVYDAGGPVAIVFANGTGPTNDPFNNDFNGASGLAIESRTADFAGDGTGKTRIVTINAFYLDAHNFNFALHAANVFRPRPTASGYWAAVGLRVVTQPVATEQNTVFSVSVEIIDEAGFRVTTGADSTLAVTVAKSTGSGTLGGTLTVNAVAGLATFGNVTVDSSGSLRLGFFAPGVFGATTLPITVYTNTRVLNFALQPLAVLAGANFTLRAEIRDGNGTLVTVGPTSTAQVTVAIATGAGALSGVTALDAVAGVAQFNNLSLNAPGNVTLTISSPGMTGATSTTIVVLSPIGKSGGGGGGGCAGIAATPALSAAALLLPLMAMLYRRRRVSRR